MLNSRLPMKLTTSAPAIGPAMVPRPPASETPPTTAAAIVFKVKDTPIVGSPDPVFGFAVERGGSVMQGLVALRWDGCCATSNRTRTTSCERAYVFAA